MEDYCQLRSLLCQAELLGVTPLLSGATGAWLGCSESHSETSLEVQSQSHSDKALGIDLSQGHTDGNRHSSSHLRTIFWGELRIHDSFWRAQFYIIDCNICEHR